MFQSLPGNLGVPAELSAKGIIQFDTVSIPSREFGSSGRQVWQGNQPYTFVSIPSREFGSSGLILCARRSFCQNSVSIPSREFGSSGIDIENTKRARAVGFNPFQGIWEFRLFHVIRNLVLFTSFNPFQGIWEFRQGTGSRRGQVESRFQSLPGNLGVPATLHAICSILITLFQSLPGNLGVPAHFKPCVFDQPGMFQSLPGNLGVPAVLNKEGKPLMPCSFNPFQGIWEFRHNNNL